MPYEKTLIDKLVLGISSALGGISKWEGQVDDARKFLEGINITLPSDVEDLDGIIPDEFEELLTAVGAYESAILDYDSDGDDEVNAVYGEFTTMATKLTNCISAIPTLYGNIKNIDNVVIDIEDAADIGGEFAKRFIDYSLVNYCRNSYPAIYGILLVVGVIDKTDNITKFHFDRLLQIFKNPSNLIKDVYYNNDDLRLEKIITNVISIALSFNKSE